MYNKCSKCGRQIDKGDEVRIVPDQLGGTTTLCVACYKEKYR